MRPAVAAALVLGVGLPLAQPALGQGGKPLRKSDLIRHLSGSALSRTEIADLIRNHCLSFTPTERDRADLKALGADAGIMRSIDGCVRRAGAAPAPLRVEPEQTSVAAEMGSEATITVKLTRGVEVVRGRRLALLGSSRIPGGRAAGAGGRDVEATTNGVGIATFHVPAGTVPGTYRLVVIGVAGEQLEGRTTVVLETTPAGGLQADARPNRIEVRPGGDDRRVPVTVVVRDGRGNPLPGQPVELGTLTGTSNARGEVSYSVATAAYRSAATLEVKVRGHALATVEIAVSAVPSASRTGFIAGLGQRGRVGSRLPQPLVFEVRDTANVPIAGRAVVFLAAGADLEQVRATTDSDGLAQASVLLGPKAGPAVVTARVGAIERQAPLVALAGPPARLLVVCGSGAVDGRLVIAADTPAVLRVSAQDAFGNLVSLSALRASVGDDRVLRQVGMVMDSLRGQGVITFRPNKAGGTTNLAIQASGLRASFVASVQPPPRTGGAARPRVCG